MKRFIPRTLLIAVVLVLFFAATVGAVSGVLNMSAGDTEAVSCPNALTTSGSTPNSLTLQCAADTTTTVPVSTTTAPRSGLGNVAFYGDSLVGDYYWRGYIGSGLAADLTAAGFGPTLDLKGCGGMSMAQFVGRVAADGAPQDVACKNANTVTAHAASIAASPMVVIPFITNDWPYNPTQFEADVHAAISRIEALNPTVHHIVLIKNYMTGTHSADLVAQVARENQTIVKVFDESSVFGGNYTANCANPANQNHPTTTCWNNLTVDIVAKLKALG